MLKVFEFSGLTYDPQKIEIFYHDHVDATEYYSKEMGEQDQLKKVVVINKDVRVSQDLIDLKFAADKIENFFGHDQNRMVNIDPGILKKHQVLLTSHKNYTHRLQVHENVYLELELLFQEKKFTPLKWTYSDYKEEGLLRFLEKHRKDLI